MTKQRRREMHEARIRRIIEESVLKIGYTVTF